MEDGNLREPVGSNVELSAHRFDRGDGRTDSKWARRIVSNVEECLPFQLERALVG